MIYTVTLNPSIDYIVQVPSVQLGALNRMNKDLKLPGGKGINVSRVLNRLNQPSTALGFLGGFTGNFISDWLEKEGVHTQFVSIEGDTRINVKLKSDTETELNAQGPAITKAEANQLMDQIESLTAEDIIILSGNKPPSLSENFYQELITKVVSKQANFVIDTAGTELLNALAHKPLLVKPNHHELADLFGVEIGSVEESIPYGKKLLALGAKHALVSMAGDGALFFTGEKVYRAVVPKGIVKNSVGAGDSMVAGFIGELVDTKDPLRAFKKSVATGSATAFSDDLATRSEIEALLKEVIVTEIAL
ncbi:1-phosphofructokinase [Carnobacterium pleistocenium]|uniref:1-phosphofructokinase n=1 Tax=Carnobacterium pleistocenium TaxID=181073 RepID=UPI00055980F2|nr:1-phosphofructokinase [Carnobacterium pleistocenium]